MLLGRPKAQCLGKQCDSGLFVRVLKSIIAPGHHGCCGFPTCAGQLTKSHGASSSCKGPAAIFLPLRDVVVHCAMAMGLWDRTTTIGTRNVNEVSRCALRLGNDILVGI